MSDEQSQAHGCCSNSNGCCGHCCCSHHGHHAQPNRQWNWGWGVLAAIGVFLLSFALTIGIAHGMGFIGHDRGYGCAMMHDGDDDWGGRGMMRDFRGNGQDGYGPDGNGFGPGMMRGFQDAQPGQTPNG